MFWQKQFSPTEHEASWLDVLLLLPSSVSCLSWKAVFGGEHVKESVSKAVVLICNIFFPFPYISENNNNNKKNHFSTSQIQELERDVGIRMF